MCMYTRVCVKAHSSVFKPQVQVPMQQQQQQQSIPPGTRYTAAASTDKAAANGSLRQRTHTDKTARLLTHTHED